MKSKLAVAIAATAALLGMSSFAQAGGIVEACFDKQYVEAKYKYGSTLLKKESRNWTNLDNGPGLVTRVRHPAVRIQTAKKVADDHYILVPVKCP